jgi:hypothetical protein
MVRLWGPPQLCDAFEIVREWCETSLVSPKHESQFLLVRTLFDQQALHKYMTEFIDFNDRLVSFIPIPKSRGPTQCGIHHPYILAKLQ